MASFIRPQCLHARTLLLPTTTSRAFTTTPLLSWRSHKNDLAKTHEYLPAYPHGPARWYKQSDKGLYGGVRLRFGNNVSPDTETKTRRKFRPNIKRKALFSKALNQKIRVRVSTRVLRTIDKVGGLDEYLLGEKSARVRELGMEGWRLRCLVMGTPAVQARLNKQRREMGLPEEDYAALARVVEELKEQDLMWKEEELRKRKGLPIPEPEFEVDEDQSMLAVEGEDVIDDQEMVFVESGAARPITVGAQALR